MHYRKLCRDAAVVDPRELVSTDLLRRHIYEADYKNSYKSFLCHSVMKMISFYEDLFGTKFNNRAKLTLKERQKFHRKVSPSDWLHQY